MSYADLKSKVFVITGAGSGMGRCISMILAKQGAHLGLLDLQKPDHVLEAVKALGSQAISLQCDVRKSDDVETAVKTVFDRFGRIDGAANMAGILAKKPSALDDTSDANWENMIQTNLTGVRNCLAAEIRNMKGPGSIINAASTAGQIGAAFQSDYASSKWGVIGLTKSAAAETGLRGIRVNAIAPGFVETPLTECYGGREGWDAMGKMTAFGRCAQPEEVARVIVFLLSDEAAYMTGSVVNVDGGYLLTIPAIEK